MDWLPDLMGSLRGRSDSNLKSVSLTSASLSQLASDPDSHTDSESHSEFSKSSSTSGSESQFQGITDWGHIRLVRGRRRFCPGPWSEPHIKGIKMADLGLKVGLSHTRGQSSHPKRWQTPPGAAPAAIGRGPGYPIRSRIRDNPTNVPAAHIVTWEACWPLIG